MDYIVKSYKEKYLLFFEAKRPSKVKRRPWNRRSKVFYFKSIHRFLLFIRRPGIVALKLAIDWIKQVAKERKIKIQTTSPFKEGEYFGAGEPILFIKGSFKHLVDLETLFLQKIGPACIAAANAYQMCMDLPKTSFIAMDARHCAGSEMSHLMSYASSVGSKAAKKKKAKGFIGTSIKATSHYFPSNKALGTMPHAIIGYAGSTLEAVKMFHQSFPKNDLVVLPDYFGKEITDSIQVCNHFDRLSRKGKVLIRLDTPSGRFIEGLDTSNSYEILEKFSPGSIKEYRSDDELRHLVGPGVYFCYLVLDRSWMIWLSKVKLLPLVVLQMQNVGL